MHQPFISINDYRDIDDDRKHPVKCNRPLASGKVEKPVAVGILLSGTILGLLADTHFQFLFILILYFFINLFYSFGLKNFAILDILLLSSGFVLRVKGGAIISGVEATEWLIIMTFLLSLFMAIAKRRDDLLAESNHRNGYAKIDERL
ncbi:MAG: UbiA family prenyltransferase [Puia sp.]